MKEIKLAPEELSVGIVYQAPGPDFMFNMVAGVRYEAQQREGQSRKLDLVSLTFGTQGTALAPVTRGASK